MYLRFKDKIWRFTKKNYPSALKMEADLKRVAYVG